MQDDNRRKPYTDHPLDTYEDNVAPHSHLYDLPVEKRRELSQKFGPNWASIMSGLGDQ